MVAPWLARLPGLVGDRWRGPPLGTALADAKHGVRFVASHAGIPALVLAALLVVLGIRIATKSARFLAQTAAILLVFLAVTELGWIRW